MFEFLRPGAYGQATERLKMGLALATAHEETGLDRERALESGVAIEAFLREVETRAYRIALLNVRDRDEACLIESFLDDAALDARVLRAASRGEREECDAGLIARQFA